MNKKEALKVLEISDDLSDLEIVCQVKQRLKKLHKDSIENLSEKIEACKFLTDGQEDQAKVFSDLVILSINNNKLDFLELLLKTVKNNSKFNYLNTEGTGGNMPLNSALKYTSYEHESRVKAIDLLLKHGADSNTKNREGKSPLHCVINNSDGTFCHKVIELLLDRQANPNAEDNQGKTLLHYLFEDGLHDRVEIVKLLLTRGANPYIQNGCGESLLYKAYSEKRDDFVELLLKHSVGFHIKSEHVQSLLYKACSEGRGNIVKLLLKYGADPNVQNEHGESLLYKACSEGRDSIVRLLLEHKANPNIKDQKGRTPLSFVFENRPLLKSDIGIVELLLKRGANPNVQDQEGRSLFYYIIDSYRIDDRYKVVELLLDKGADPNMQDDLGRASLHYLCKKGSYDGGIEIAKLLLKKGADPDLKDKSGRKPIDYINPNTDVGKLFGAINYEKAAILGIAALLATTCSIALVYLAVNVSINIVQVSCFALTAVMATAALYCACCAVKTLFFPPGPSSEFTEARAEFSNSQKSLSPAGGA